VTPAITRADPVSGFDPAAEPGWTRWANAGVKAALVLAFAVVLIARPDVVEGKNMAARSPLFLGPAVIVPILARLRRWQPYPHLADALLSTPFLLDTLGNLFGFYDRYKVTDDVLHFVNWVFLVMAFHAFRYRNVRDDRDAILLGAAFGSLMIVVWEAFEWLISDAGPLAGDVPDALSLSYGDTIGDLVISSTGGLIGSLIGRWWVSRLVGGEQSEPHEMRRRR
jgi:hypothetical protein